MEQNDHQGDVLSEHPFLREGCAPPGTRAAAGHGACDLA